MRFIQYPRLLSYPKTANDAGFRGIVVEMIPQHRPIQWNLHKLLRVETEGRPVLVVGQLFYDMKHKVNDDPSNPTQGQPIRASLFEIHPISELVCMRDWKNLHCK